MKRSILWMTILLAAGSPGRSWSQADWLDALLPANHLLEKIPFVDENGQAASSGLFTFEDLNADGRKDLLLAHREAVAADKLDQPHPQALAICFFEPAKKVYNRVFEDEGGPLQWVRILVDEKTSRKFLALEREDWRNEHILRVYTYGQPGHMDKVLETQTPWSFASVIVSNGKVEVLYSSKETPVTPAKAEDVFVWNETAKKFVDSKGVAVGNVALVKAPTPTPVVVAKAEEAPAGDSFALPPPEELDKTLAPTATPKPSKPVAVAAAPKPKPKKAAAKPASPPAEPESAAQTEAVAPSEPEAAEPQAAAPQAAAPQAVPAKKGWWDEPFSAKTAYAKLKGTLIPRRVKNNQLVPLGGEANAFFERLKAAGITGDEFSDYRAGYYTTVSSELFAIGDAQRGQYYLDMVLKNRPEFQEALDLKAKVSSGTLP